MKFKSDNKLPREDYLGIDVVAVARTFLGKELHTFIDGHHTAGKIIEVEAYCGATDRACHAFPNKKTSRTATMYQEGGIAYVYLVYGMHHLFNIVTNVVGKADAVLIRAIEPIAGIEIMQERRAVERNDVYLTGGPGRLTQALGITVQDNQTDLLEDRIWLADNDPIHPSTVVADKRIGVEYAGKDADLPWRFYIHGNKYVSK